MTNKETTMVGPRASLVGPPELYSQEQTPPPIPSGNRFIDSLIARSNPNRHPTRPSNPCLDLFASPFSVESLELAWAHNPLTALKIVFNLRAVRGTGKSDRDSFFAAALWLHRRHPKTLAANVAAIPAFGCFKDLPEIVVRLVGPPDRRRVKKTAISNLRPLIFNKPLRAQHHDNDLFKKKKKKRKMRTNLLPKDIRISDAESRSKKDEDSARALRKRKWTAMAKTLFLRYTADSDFRFLYDAISDHFAACLAKDLQFLTVGDSRSISLAAKWCPSLDSSFDRSTLLCESIARKLFPMDCYGSIEESHYAYRVRDRLRKEVLVPLRKALELPEVFIGQNRWDLVQYNRVASVAMKSYKKKFLQHDADRFNKHLEDVKAGKAKIAVGALLPHEIVAECVNGVPGWDADVAELQWKRMVESVSESGRLRNCLAVMESPVRMRGSKAVSASVAMALMITELSDDPWKGKIVTYGCAKDDPRLRVVEGDDLRSRVEFMMKLEGGGFEAEIGKVFELIVQVAENGKLRAEEMVKRVIVLSCAGYRREVWERLYDAAVGMFKERGYGGAVPEIVYWDLNDDNDDSDEEEQDDIGYCDWAAKGPRKGMAVLRGLSKNVMKMILGNDDDDEPMSELSAMEVALSGPEYQTLVVVD